MSQKQFLFILAVGTVISFGVVFASGPYAPQPIAPEERLHVAFIENDYGANVSRVKYGIWDGMTLPARFQTIDADSRLYQVSDSALDTALSLDGNHHMAYLKNGAVKYRNSFSAETAPIQASAGGANGLALDLNSRGEPVLVFVGRDNNLYLLRRSSGIWVRSNPLLTLPLVADSRIAFAVNQATGNYHIFYTHRVGANQTDLREFIITPAFTIAGNNLVKPSLDPLAVFNFKNFQSDTAGTYEDFADIYLVDSSPVWTPRLLGQSSGFSDFDSIGLPLTWVAASDLNTTNLNVFYSFDRVNWATSTVITTPMPVWYPSIDFSPNSGILGVGYSYTRQIFGQPLQEIGVAYSKLGVPPFDWKSGILVRSSVTTIQFASLKLEVE